MPAVHQDYWIPKFNRTVERDKRNQKELQRIGWNVIVLWECEIKENNRLADRLMNSITSFKLHYSEDLPIFKMAAEAQEPYDNIELNVNARYLIKSKLSKKDKGGRSSWKK